MSDLKELDDIGGPVIIQKFPLMNGKTVIIGPLSIQSMREIEKKYGSFETWAKRVTNIEDVTLEDVAAMLWGLAVNKADFKDDEEMLNAFPAKPNWLVRVKEIMLDVINESVQDPEDVPAGEGEQGN
jgi:hypothetical protein